MRAGGCDLFPDEDARSYMKGLPGKHPVVEKHLQSCMGLLCNAYLFAWSRWNASCTPREIVVQLKEIHGCVVAQVDRKNGFSNFREFLLDTYRIRDYNLTKIYESIPVVQRFSC